MRKYQLNLPTFDGVEVSATCDQSFKSAMNKFASLTSSLSPISSVADGVMQIRVRSSDGDPISGGGGRFLRARKDLKNTISLPTRLTLEPRDSGSNVTI